MNATLVIGGVFGIWVGQAVKSDFGCLDRGPVAIGQPASVGRPINTGNQPMWTVVNHAQVACF